MRHARAVSTLRRRTVAVLAVVSGALWLAVAISMAAFADGAEHVDEGVNVHALGLTLLATLTSAMFVLTRHPRREKSDGSAREPSG